MQWVRRDMWAVQDRLRDISGRDVVDTRSSGPGEDGDAVGKS